MNFLQYLHLPYVLTLWISEGIILQMDQLELNKCLLNELRKNSENLKAKSKSKDYLY